MAVGGAYGPDVAADEFYAKAAGSPHSTPASGISTICQEPDQGPHGGFPFVHSDKSYGSRAAESFVSPGGGIVDRVQWWGAYMSPSLAVCAPNADDFTLTVYADAGGVPGPVVSTNNIGGSASSVSTGQFIVFVGIKFVEYTYATELLQPFPADAGATYWVEIVRDAYDVDGCSWWWETAPQGTNGDGVANWDQGHGTGYRMSWFDLAMCVRIAPDCNRNGIADNVDISSGVSSDCNETGIPDACETIGDYDGDGEVNLDDHGQWEACMTGPDAGSYALFCQPFDLAADDDVDLMDFAGFQALFGCP